MREKERERAQAGVRENRKDQLFTCRMVSKLKVNPFQSVNSPLEAPTIRRRPSGDHFIKNMNKSDY